MALPSAEPPHGYLTWETQDDFLVTHTFSTHHVFQPGVTVTCRDRPYCLHKLNSLLLSLFFTYVEPSLAASVVTQVQMHLSSKW